MILKYASLFSGIGGFEYGIQKAIPLANCVYSCEADKYARAIYRKQFKPVTSDDVRTVRGQDIQKVDLICGGPPCQDFSLAGKRCGLEGERSGLMLEFIRIVRETKPKHILIENVKGLMSSTTHITFDDILPLLYREVMSDTRWELEYTPMKKWIIFSENIKTYIVKKWLNTSALKKKQLDIYSTKNLVLNYGTLEFCLNRGAKKRLKFLVDQILQIMKKLNCYQKEQMHLSESNEDDVISSLKLLYSTENLNTLDIHLLEKIMDMFDGAEMSQNQCLAENSAQTNLFTTSMGLNLTIDQKICGYAQEVNIALFIIKQWHSSTNLWKLVLSNLIEKKENIFYVRAFNIIIQKLYELGYDIEWQILNSANFNVPQHRERVFIIGHLGGFSRRKVFPIRQSNSKNPIRTEEKRFIDLQLEGSQMTDITRTIQSRYYKGYSARYGENSGVLDGHRIRRFTPLECERLQGFPDNFTTRGENSDGKTISISDTQRYKCLGNAVTTNVVAAIISKLYNV